MSPHTTHDAWRPSALAVGRQAYRRRQTLRSVLVSSLASGAVAVALTIAIVNSPGWPRVQQSFFDFSIGLDSLPEVAKGLLLNLEVFAASGLASLVVGLAVAVLRTLPGSMFWPARALAAAYVDVFRGVPLLLVLYLVGFGLPGLRLQGIPSDTVVLGSVALTLCYSAYMAEVFRAGIESVHPSQRAAARALGLSAGQTMRVVILPQAVRRVVPPLMNDLVSLTKDSGLISVLGIPLDAIRRAQIAAYDYANYTPYVVAGLLFMLVAIPMTRATDAVSKRYGYTFTGGAV